MQITNSSGEILSPIDLVAGLLYEPIAWLVIGGLGAYVIGVLILGNRGDRGLFHGDFDADGGDGGGD